VFFRKKRIPKFYFCIPLKPKSRARDWEYTMKLFSHTLDSLLNQDDDNFSVIIAGHDRPDVPQMKDSRVVFHKVAFRKPKDGREGKQDQTNKMKFLAAMVGNKGGGYFMTVDSDDLVHREIVSYVRRHDNRTGYMIRAGYVWDYSAGLIGKFTAKAPNQFFNHCGTSSIIYLAPSSVPRLKINKKDFLDCGTLVDSLQGHGGWEQNLMEVDVFVDTLPFRGAIYRLNTNENASYTYRRDAKTITRLTSPAMRSPVDFDSVWMDFGFNKIFGETGISLERMKKLLQLLPKPKSVDIGEKTVKVDDLGADVPDRQPKKRSLAKKRENSPFFKRFKLESKPGANIERRLHKVDAGFAVSRQNKFAYLRIPKCANSTVVATLAINELGWSTADWWSIPEEKRNHIVEEYFKKDLFTKPSSLKSKECQRVVDNYLKFVVVRNPYSRVRSAFKDRIINRQRWSKHGFAKPPSYLEFLQYLDNGGIGADKHWWPMFYFCPFECALFDEVVHLENLADSLSPILFRIYERECDIVDVKWHATGSGEAQSLSSLLPEEAEIVNRLYAEDFRKFGYEMLHDHSDVSSGVNWGV